MSTSGTSRSVTVRSVELSRGLSKFTADPAQLSGGTAQRELGFLGSQEITVRRVIGVHADTAVHVDNGVRHPMPGIGGPERRAGHVDLGRDVLGDLPGRLGESEPQTLDVDVAVGQSLPHRLEAADWTVELLTGA